MTTFGAYFKTKRLEIGKTLRAFCAENWFDPGNISKLERGRMSPPASEDKLSEMARALRLQSDTEDWIEFFDLADASATIN